MVLKLLIHLSFLIYSIGFPASDGSTEDHKDSNLKSTAKSKYDKTHLDSKLDFEVYEMALTGYYKLLETGGIKTNRLVIIDYSQVSSKKRFFVLDIEKDSIIYNTLVAHGKNSGDSIATTFSNTPKSKMSSLGFYITGETYDGKHEYSLKLDGVDTTFNNNARQRGIVIHGADYVNEDFIKDNARLGRSFGCPALPQALNQQIIQDIKDGSCLFIFGNDDNYIKHSKYLNI